jgi:hypothetical protein
MKLALLVALVGCGGAVPAPIEQKGPTSPTGERLTPDQFQTLATEAARRIGGAVFSWGVADLADDDHEVRFAVLENEEKGEGAYLLSARGQLYALAFDADGRTKTWGPRFPGWKELKDKRLVHLQGHRAGYHSVEVALRGGRFVMLKWESLEDARDNDVADVKEYPCAPQCKPFAPSEGTYGLKHPRGPARTIDELFPPVK